MNKEREVLKKLLGIKTCHIKQDDYLFDFKIGTYEVLTIPEGLSIKGLDLSDGKLMAQVPNKFAKTIDLYYYIGNKRNQLN